MSDIKHLIKIYNQYKKIKSMSEGGETPASKPANSDKQSRMEKIPCYDDGGKIPEKSFSDKLSDYFSTRDVAPQKTLNTSDANKFSQSLKNATSSYTDGGKVKPKEDDSYLYELGEVLKKQFATPTPTPTPGPTQQDKYEEIRKQNRKNFDENAMSSGGEVFPKPMTHRVKLPEMKNIMSSDEKVIDTLHHIVKGRKGMYDGGIAQPTSYTPEQQSTLGVDLQNLHPDWSEEKVQDYINTLRPQQPSQGDPKPAFMGSVKRPINTDTGDLGQNISNQMQMMQPVAQNYANGGEVDPITGNIDPNSPEGLALIQQASYPSAPQMNQEDIPLEGSKIQGEFAPKPASEEDVSLPDDATGLETQYLGEDISAKEKDTDGGLDTEDMDIKEQPGKIAENQIKKQESQPIPENASPTSEAKSGQNPEGKTRDIAETPEDATSSIANLVKASQDSQANALKEAQNQRDSNIAGQQLMKGAALFSAGKLKTSPEESLKVVGENDKYVGLPITKYEEQIANQKHDPNSDFSKAYAKSAGDILGMPGKFAGMTAETIDKIIPVSAKKMANDVAVKKFNQTVAHQTAMEGHQKTQEQLQRERLDVEKQNVAGNKELKAQTAQDRALSQTKTILESARGNPAAAQAEKDLYAVNKVDSLLKIYPDPNKMPEAQVNLVISEIGKIAQGGVPTGHELQSLKPGSAEGKLQNLYSKLINEPTSANAGAYLKEFQKYNNSLKKDAEKVIKDKYGRVIESSKRQLGDENYKVLKDQYLNRFNETEGPSIDADLTKMNPEQLKAYIKTHGGQ